MGGLGNQIFQIFATISYAIKSKNQFKFLNLTTLGGGSTTVRYTFWESFFSTMKPFLMSELPIIKSDLVNDYLSYLCTNNFPFYLTKYIDDEESILNLYNHREKSLDNLVKNKKFSSINGKSFFKFPLNCKNIIFNKIRKITK